ncbi:hypothetical protein [Bombella apis]|uniref:Pilus assembly protein n=1 Tax=Bombella apis TaxID=1785988 RepID=A0ABR9MND8_9PROT|nr:hypothetical protein [Bombella apis]MBE1723168.1 hypothetical protein [Bombella apis]MBR9730975.1 hypothetical protein [Bombella apis]MPW00462.1 hypothetical protein [Bombella apis]
MMYLYAGLGVAAIAALTLFGWVLYRAGRNAARVRSEQQNVTEANAQNATMARMNEAAASAPQTDDELLAKLRDGKEGQ